MEIQQSNEMWEEMNAKWVEAMFGKPDDDQDTPSADEAPADDDTDTSSKPSPPPKRVVEAPADDEEAKAPAEEEEEEGTLVEEEEEEGMGEPTLSAMVGEGMTHTFSDHSADEEWVLEHIVARRKAKAPVPAVEGLGYDVEDAGQGQGVKVKVSRRGEEIEYLCKWKWYPDPTWESRTLLEEEGFGGAMRQHDAKVAEQKLHKGQNVSRPANVFVLPSSTRTDSLSDASAIFSCMRGTVLNRFSDSFLQVLSITDVAKESLIRRFLTRWKHGHPRPVPTLVFHGTRSSNIASIVDRGLIVPGTTAGVHVANGSACGVGIYSSTTPSTPSGYCKDGKDCIVVCAGLSGGDTGTQQYGDWRVFFDASCIVPLWVVHFRRGKTATGQTASDVQNWTLHKLSTHVNPSRLSSVKPLTEQRAGESEALSHAIASGTKKAQVADESRVPAELRRKGVSKRMIKQGPRKLKELYKEGLLKNLKNE